MVAPRRGSINISLSEHTISDTTGEVAGTFPRLVAGEGLSTFEAPFILSEKSAFAIGKFGGVMGEG